jgi:prepilin-type N-terminal cleavage/methylation domain-containing protein
MPGPTRSPAAPRCDRGFTVIEVIVAAFLLTVGLVATAQLVLMATGQVALSRQQSTAATLASQTIEQYRDINFQTLAAGTYNSAVTLSGITYNIRTVVTTNDPQAGTDRVVVTVTWGGGQSYATSTILSPLQ